MTLRTSEPESQTSASFRLPCAAMVAICIAALTPGVCQSQMAPAGPAQARTVPPASQDLLVARPGTKNAGGIPLSAPGAPAPGAPVSGGLGPGGRVVMSLSVVLGVFFLVAWIGRKRGRAETGSLPAEAVELLGEIPIGGDDTARLLRVGSKLVLVSRSSSGLDPLTEVTDPAEVQRMTELCHVMQRGGDGWRGGNA